MIPIHPPYPILPPSPSPSCTYEAYKRTEKHCRTGRGRGADLFLLRYQNYSSAVAEGLVSVNAHNQVILTADATHTYNPDGSQGGRPSVRIESKASYKQVLVVGDFAHMPGSTCGAWPACKLLPPRLTPGRTPPPPPRKAHFGPALTQSKHKSQQQQSGCTVPTGPTMVK